MTEEGPVEILWKRNACFKISCEPIHLGVCTEVLNMRTGKPYKDRCQVFIQDFGVATVKHNIASITELKQKHSTSKTVGFHANKGN